MIPFAVMNPDRLNIPQVAKEINRKTLTFPIKGGIRLSNCELAMKRALLHMVTVQDIRAVHVFHYKNSFADWHFADWHLFEPNAEPLNQAEINGHMIFAIESMKKGELSSVLSIEGTERKLIKNKQPIIHFLRNFKVEDSVFIVIITRYTAFASGNFFNESALCRALLSHETTEKTRMPLVMIHERRLADPLKYYQKERWLDDEGLLLHYSPGRRIQGT